MRGKNITLIRFELPEILFACKSDEGLRKAILQRIARGCALHSRVSREGPAPNRGEAIQVDSRLQLPSGLPQEKDQGSAWWNLVGIIRGMVGNVLCRRTGPLGPFRNDNLARSRY